MLSKGKNITKIWIVGAPGSGKSTIAKHISDLTNKQNYELDDIFWKEHWTKVPAQEFRNKVEEIGRTGNWIINGYYEAVNEYLMEQADLIIWVRQPLAILLFRVLRRSLKRIITNEKVCNGNFEDVRFLFSKDGIIVHLFRQKKAIDLAFHDFKKSEKLYCLKCRNDYIVLLSRLKAK